MSSHIQERSWGLFLAVATQEGPYGGLQRVNGLYCRNKVKVVTPLSQSSERPGDLYWQGSPKIRGGD